jgi:hypothetical protein
VQVFFKADEDEVTQWQLAPAELIGPSRVDPFGLVIFRHSTAASTSRHVASSSMLKTLEFILTVYLENRVFGEGY